MLGGLLVSVADELASDDNGGSHAAELPRG